jgi:hypothetical protein
MIRALRITGPFGFVCVFIFLVLVLAPAFTGRAHAQQGPAMNSFYLNVAATDGECCANVTFVQNLPPERKLPLPAVSMERLSKGKYVILAQGAAPFPTPPPRSGFFVAVTAVASNAHCFEVGTLVRGARDLLGTVSCVDPAGAPVDSQFSWSYGADSLDFVQFTVLPKNFAYAQVLADGKLGSYFSPVGATAASGGVSVQRTGSGLFKVKFAGLGTATGALDKKTGAGVLVSNVCPEGPCGTQVCVPAAWSLAGNASTVDVRCSDPRGAPVDAGFRVFLGQEALNSQSFGKFAVASDYKKYHQHYNEGTNYGWVVSSERGAPAGEQALPHPQIAFMNKGKDFPGPRKIDYFHLATGKYRVKFKDQLIYGQTYWSMHASARESEAGTYCNVGDIDYKTAQVGVNCYDGTGAPRDATWSLGMRRLYN